MKLIVLIVIKRIYQLVIIVRITMLICSELWIISKVQLRITLILGLRNIVGLKLRVPAEGMLYLIIYWKWSLLMKLIP